MLFTTEGAWSWAQLLDARTLEQGKPPLNQSFSHIQAYGIFCEQL